MPNRAITLTVLPCCLFGLARAYAQAPGRADIVAREALQSAGYGKFWSGDLGIDGGDRVRKLYLLDENLYVKTRAGIVYAMQADTGLPRWARPLNDDSFRERPPTHVQTVGDDGPAVFVTHSRIHVFDRYSGDIIRLIELPFPAGGGAVADVWHMYLGSADGKFYALRWPCGLTRKPLSRWRVRVEGAVVSQPVLMTNGRLYVASDGGVVYCVGAVNKALYWSFQTSGRIAGGLFADESGVYVASTDHRLYVLDPDHGTLTRSYTLPGPLSETPVVSQRTVYQYCQQEGLFAFDVDTRRLLWHKPHARRYVARAAETLVLKTGSGDLLVVDNDSGEERHVIALPEGVLVAANSRDATLYLAAPDGRLLCARPLGYPYLRREQIARARAGLHRRPARTATARPAEIRASSSGGRTTPEEWLNDPLRSGRPR